MNSITAPFKSMLKIILGTSSPTNVRKSRKTGNHEIDHSDEVRKVEENLLKINPSTARFLSPKASITFFWLRRAFIKVLILHDFALERHIQIEADASGFTLGRIFCQTTSGYVTHRNPNLSIFEISPWHSVTFFFRKM